MQEAITNVTKDALKTRVSLLLRARDTQSQLAWEELLGFYDPFFLKVLSGMGFKGHDLEDARQQVSLRLWKGLRTYEYDQDRAKFRTWLARLIRNTALNIIRADNRNPAGPSLDDDSSIQSVVIAEESEIEAKVEQDWQKYIVELALQRVSGMFSGNAITVFTKSLEGLSVEEISEQLQIKTNTVYILKHRVKTLLMREIQALKADLESFGDASIPPPNV